MAREVIDLADLTLDEMDAVERVKAEHGVGYTVAATVVWMRRNNPDVDVAAVRTRRARDVQIVDTTGADETGPTNARS